MGVTGTLPDLRSVASLTSLSCQNSPTLTSATMPFWLIDPSTPSSNPNLDSLNLGTGPRARPSLCFCSRRVLSRVTALVACGRRRFGAGGCGVAIPPLGDLASWLGAHTYKTSLKRLVLSQRSLSGPVGTLLSSVPALNYLDLSTNTLVSARIDARASASAGDCDCDAIAFGPAWPLC